MFLRSILVGLDGSAFSESAINLAIRWSKRFDCSVAFYGTPIDREDILRSIVSLDDIIGYDKTTVRKMELLQVTPDQPMDRP